jgi:DNA-binding beta-propeller fold protein YncE
MDPTGQFAYVANYRSNKISAYTIDEVRGALVPVVGSPFPTGKGPVSVAVDSKGQFVYLYLVHNLSANVSAYAINSTTGALALVAGSPLPWGRAYVAVTTFKNIAVTIDGSTEFATMCRTDPRLFFDALVLESIKESDITAVRDPIFHTA